MLGGKVRALLSEVLFRKGRFLASSENFRQGCEGLPMKNILAHY
jgi:hypothetical protein